MDAFRSEIREAESRCQRSIERLEGLHKEHCKEYDSKVRELEHRLNKTENLISNWKGRAWAIGTIALVAIPILTNLVSRLLPGGK